MFLLVFDVPNTQFCHILLFFVFLFSNHKHVFFYLQARGKRARRGEEEETERKRRNIFFTSKKVEIFVFYVEKVEIFYKNTFSIKSQTCISS